MSIEPVGVLTFIAGLICLQLGLRAAVVGLILATLLGSAAAILVGASNIPPAHLLLAFVAASTLAHPLETSRAIKAAKFPEPGFWLVCLLIYGLVTGIMMPRLLAGSMPIIPLGVTDYADTGSTVPLGPVSSNLTQGIYLIGDLVCFLLIVAIASTEAGFATIAFGLCAYAAGNILLALADLATYATGTQWLLSFIRNAQYTLHIEEQVSGLKRIVGSFTEAAAFAGATLTALGFTGTLWLCGRRPVVTGTLALISLALVILSTSSTGLVGAPLVLALLYVTALTRRGVDLNRPLSATLVLCTPLVVLAAILATSLDEQASGPIREYISELIFSKATSSSAIERAAWNAFALRNFVDSYGLGVGLGTVRTSSFPIALLSNVGVPGTIFYALFAASGFLSRRGTAGSFQADVRLAARNGCLATIIGGVFAGSTVEQGLLFYVLAGVACAEPERNLATVSTASSQRAGVRI